MTKTANYVVIGSGGAGLASAVAAMQNGVKNIIVLEKSAFIGGNSRMAGGDLHVADPADRNNGNKKVDDEFRETMEFHHYRMINPKVLRALLDETSNTIDFVREMGIPYRNGGTMLNNKYPFGNFYAVIKRMAELLLAEEGNEILRNTGATKILTDDSGKVCGVEAVTSDGETITIETPAVSITTGGFTGNSQLLHQYFPEEYNDIFYTDALPLQGDGIALAKSAGAALASHCTMIKENAYSCDSRLDAPNRTAHNGCSVWVNTYGERFHNESFTMGNECANALCRQPGMIGYALFDQNVFEVMKHMPMPGPGGPNDEMPGGPGGPDGEMPGGPGGLGGPGHKFPDPIESMEKEYRLKTGWVQKADTIEELAEKIGVDADALAATIEEYNGFCENQRDALFAKDAKYLIAINKAPFYALKFRPILIDTQGPIIVNEKMEVLSEATHKPIPGLYAAGVCASGAQGNDYHLRGSNLGFAVTGGRLIGRSVAAYLK